MYERHNTTIVVFGGNQSRGIEYKGTSLSHDRTGGDCSCAYCDISGMAGGQVLEWADLNSEIKIAGVKDVKK